MGQVVSAFVGAVVAIIVVQLTRRSETIKQFQSLRAAAYADFVRGIAALGVIQGHLPEFKEDLLKGKETTMLVADAKSRIAIYGSEPVVKLLAAFLRGGAVLDSPERAKEFTNVCQMMRNDRSTKPANVTSDDMHFLLFGFDPKDYLGKVTAVR